jgi:hypothetical protein
VHLVHVVARARACIKGRGCGCSRRGSRPRCDTVTRPHPARFHGACSMKILPKARRHEQRAARDDARERRGLYQRGSDAADGTRRARPLAAFRSANAQDERRRRRCTRVMRRGRADSGGIAQWLSSTTSTTALGRRRMCWWADARPILRCVVRSELQWKCHRRVLTAATGTRAQGTAHLEPL